MQFGSLANSLADDVGRLQELLAAAIDRAESGERQWVALEQAVYALITWARNAVYYRPLTALFRNSPVANANALVERVVNQAYKPGNAHATAEALVQQVRSEGELRALPH